jgi:MFS family permease
VKLAYRWEVVLLLWFSYALHQADKQLYSVVLAPLQTDLALSGAQAGLVASAFTLVVAVISPLAGALGDRLPKARLLAAAMTLWSTGVLGTGWSATLPLLLFYRAGLTGGGEAFYPPVSHALLAGHHQQSRALAISIHQTAQYCGPIAGGLLGGWLAQQYGWRQTFWLFGFAGIALGCLLGLRLRDAAGLPPAQEPLLAGFRRSLASPAVRRIGLAFAFVLFASLGYNTFAPLIVHEQFGLSLAEAGFYTAAAGNGSAMLGALIGGWWSDRVAAQSRSRFLPQAASLLLAAPFMLLMGAASTLTLMLGALTAVGFLRGIYEGTLAVSLYDFVAPQHRSSAAALVLLIANLLASPSAALLGWWKDQAALGPAVSSLGLCFLAAAITLWFSRRLPLPSLR